MRAPRRWADDPDADPELRDVLRRTPRASGLDDVTRRRLAARVARSSIVPAVAAAWLFVKSAGAALGVVLGAGAVASYTGIVPWSASSSAPRAPAPAPTPRPMPKVVERRIVEPAQAPEPAPVPVNPTPSLPIASVSSSTGSLSLEVALLEQARREMRVAPAIALSIAREHEARYPRGQLSAERTLIQIEALHRLGRESEAVRLARQLLAGGSRGLYGERVRKLLGDRALED